MFAELPVDELTQLAPSFRVDSYLNGKKIVSEGEVSDEFFILVEGRLAVKGKVAGENVEFLRLNEGDFFGEAALFKNAKRMADVYAASTVTLLVLRSADFGKFVQTHPKTGINILSELCHLLFLRLQSSHQQLKASQERAMLTWGKI